MSLRSPPQVATVISVARSAKRAEKLIRMRLENHGPRPNHFPTLAPGVTRRAHLLKPTMGRGPRIRLWQCALPGCSPGSVYIDYHPLVACSVTQTTGRRKGLAG